MKSTTPHSRLRRAVCVGTNGDPGPGKLSYAESDARKMARCLALYCDFECRVLSGKLASPEGIRAALDWAGQASELSIFYFAGHGEQDESRHRLHLSADAKGNSRHIALVPDVAEWSGSRPGAHWLWIVDACRRSPTIRERDYGAVDSPSQPNPAQHIPYFQEYASIIFPCAFGCTTEERSNLKGGIATEALCKALQGTPEILPIFRWVEQAKSVLREMRVPTERALQHYASTRSPDAIPPIINSARTIRYWMDRANHAESKLTKASENRGAAISQLEEMARLREQVRDLERKLNETELFHKSTPAAESTTQARPRSAGSSIRHPEEWVSPNSDLRLDSRKSLHLVDDSLIAAFRESLRGQHSQSRRKPTATHWQRIIPNEFRRFFEKPIRTGGHGLSLAEAFVLANWLTVTMLGSDSRPIYSESGPRQPQGVIRLVTHEELEDLARIDPTGECTGLLRRQIVKGWLTTSRNPGLHPGDLSPEDPLGIGALTDHRTWIQNNPSLTRRRLNAEDIATPLDGRDCILVFQKS